MRKFFALLIVVFALVLAVMPAAAQDASASAFVRVAHFSPDTPAVFIFAGEELVTSVRFPNVSRWVELAPGEYTFLISTEATPGEGAIEFPATLEAGQFVTVAALGSSARGSLKLQTIVEDYTRITTGKARVTVLHGIEGLPPVNVTASGGTVIDTLAYPGSIGSNDGVDTIEVPAGTYDLNVLLSGTSTVALSAPGTALDANTNYFVAAVGTPDAPQLKVVATSQADLTVSQIAAEGEARVRIAHLVADGTPVTIFLNGEIRFSGLRFGSITRFVPVLPGTYEVIVSRNSNPANAIIGPVKLTFENGSFTTVAAIGTVAEGTVAPLVITEDLNVDSGSANVTVVHAIEDAPVVDVLSGDANTVLVSGLGYPGTFLKREGGFNDGFLFATLPGGSYPLKVAPTGTTDAVLEASLIAELGKHYIVIAAGSLGGGSARLIVVETDPNALED